MSVNRLHTQRYIQKRVTNEVNAVPSAASPISAPVLAFEEPLNRLSVWGKGAKYL